MSPVFTEQDVAFMQHALMLAQNAERLGEERQEGHGSVSVALSAALGASTSVH